MKGMILEFFRALSGPDRMGIFHEAAVVIDYPGEYLFYPGGLLLALLSQD